MDARERWRASLGAAVGILLTALACRWVGGSFGIDPWLAAPLGASAVLVFAVPASPLAQPWSVIGGNTLSAFVGMACAWAIPDVAVAAAMAVAGAIALMFVLRCLHPPGGATALLAVLLHTSDARFALLPILLNSTLLVLVAIVYNSLTGRRYPHVQTPAPMPKVLAGSRFSPADLDAALNHYNQVLDVSRDDLEGLLHEAETAAYQRNLGALRCADIMSRRPLAVAPDTLVDEAWALMQGRQIKSLPVVDGTQHIVGIVTLADFVRHMQHAQASGVQAAPSRSGDQHGGAAALGGALAAPNVGQIMTSPVCTAHEQLHVIELLPLFSESGHHHIPIVDAGQTLTGIITQSDLVRALHRAVRPT